MKFKNILQMVIGFLLIFILAFVSWQVFMKPIKSEALTVEEAEKVATDRFNGEVTDTKLDHEIYEITLQLDTGEYDIKISSNSGEVLNVEQTKKETPDKELAKDDIKEIIEQKRLGEIEDIHKKDDSEVISYEAIVKNDQQKIYLTLDGETGEIMKQEEEDIQPAEDNNTAQSPESEEESDEQEEVEEEEETSQNLTTEEAVQIALDTVYGEVDDVDLEDEDGQLYYFIEIETDDDLEAEIQIHAITGEVMSIEWDD